MKAVEQDTKAEYREPSLTRYGSIAELTQAGGSAPGGLGVSLSVGVGGAGHSANVDVSAQ